MREYLRSQHQLVGFLLPVVMVQLATARLALPCLCFDHGFHACTPVSNTELLNADRTCLLFMG